MTLSLFHGDLATHSWWFYSLESGFRVLCFFQLKDPWEQVLRKKKKKATTRGHILLCPSGASSCPSLRIGLGALSSPRSAPSALFKLSPRMAVCVQSGATVPIRPALAVHTYRVCLSQVPPDREQPTPSRCMPWNFQGLKPHG